MQYIVTTRYDKPVYVLPSASHDRLIVPAPMINHTDAELGLIEARGADQVEGRDQRGRREGVAGEDLAGLLVVGDGLLMGALPLVDAAESVEAAADLGVARTEAATRELEGFGLDREGAVVVAGVEVDLGEIDQSLGDAGVLGAKRTAELIPLCHPLALSHVSVDFELRPPPAYGASENAQRA